MEFSYDDQLIKQFIDVKLNAKYNTIILVYNYNYDKDGRAVDSIDKNGYKLNYIGVAEYID